MPSFKQISKNILDYHNNKTGTKKVDNFYDIHYLPFTIYQYYETLVTNGSKYDHSQMPKKIEEIMSLDTFALYQYAETVLKKPLPEHLHKKMLLMSFTRDIEILNDVRWYLDFCKDWEERSGVELGYL
jgi:hypothetical protein